MRTSFYVFMSFFLALFSCNEGTKTAPPIANPEGLALARQYCQSCHLLPAPDELDQSTWKNEVLPRMGPRLGILTTKSDLIDGMKDLGIFPDKPLLLREEWLQIMDYYIDNAPLLNQPASIKQNLDLNLPGFAVEKPAIHLNPLSSLVQIDEEKEQVYIGNAHEEALFHFSPQNGLSEPIKLYGSPSFLHEDTSGVYVLSMGQVMPHEKEIGSLNFIPKQNGNWGAPQLLLDKLQRPVHVSIADLDQDGNKDAVIACFGNLSGELLLIKDVHSANRKTEVLRSLPGALKSAIYDFDKDGDLDILALMAQGDEGFFIYKNTGTGNFAEEKLLSFPATYGSTYFELLDFDADGWQDIVYVNGDNGDYFPIMKKHHGIRLLLNDKSNHFTESFFLQHNGAFKTETHDYDQDGDLDIAAISYFPNYKYQPQESFIYFENQGQNTFNPYSFEESTLGKWLTLDAGDIDGDADIDLVLGSALFMRAEVPNKIQELWKKEATPLLILKNKHKHDPK